MHPDLPVTLHGTETEVFKALSDLQVEPTRLTIFLDDSYIKIVHDYP